ncbi:MAG TPA: hypothetical protein DCE65_02370 [Clostridiales bacterium]|nr:hypothetical protein [Clostridiales bacterium]
MQSRVKQAAQGTEEKPFDDSKTEEQKIKDVILRKKCLLRRKFFQITRKTLDYFSLCKYNNLCCLTKTSALRHSAVW